MPTALTAAADQLAPIPARTSFFVDPASQTIASRWANAEQGLKSSERLANAAGQLGDTARQQEAADRARLDQARQNTVWGRQEQQNAALDEYRKNRGELLIQIGALDPLDPEYLKKKAAIYTSIPLEVQNDDAVESVFRRHDAIWQEKNREDNLLTRDTLMNRRRYDTALAKATAAGFPPERLKEVPIDPETGLPDIAELSFLSGQVNRAMQTQQVAAREEIKATAKKSILGAGQLDKTQKAARDEVKTFIISDEDAFPSRVGMGAKRYAKDAAEFGDDPEKAFKAKDPKGYEDAKKWDSDKMESEFSAALNYEKPEDYIKLANRVDADGNPLPLTREQEAKRRKVWEVANEQMDLGVGDAPAAPAAPAAKANEIPANIRRPEAPVSDSQAKIRQDYIDAFKKTQR